VEEDRKLKLGHGDRERELGALSGVLLGELGLDRGQLGTRELVEPRNVRHLLALVPLAELLEPLPLRRSAGLVRRAARNAGAIRHLTRPNEKTLRTTSQTVLASAKELKCGPANNVRRLGGR
jgi:hypothetical protein